MIKPKNRQNSDWWRQDWESSKVGDKSGWVKNLLSTALLFPSLLISAWKLISWMCFSSSVKSQQTLVLRRGVGCRQFFLPMWMRTEGASAVAIRGCAAPPWQAELGEPLSSVSGGCFQQSAILARLAGRVRVLSFHCSLTAAHFMDYCLPPCSGWLQRGRVLGRLAAPGHWPPRTASLESVAHVAFLLCDKRPKCKIIRSQLDVDGGVP